MFRKLSATPPPFGCTELFVGKPPDNNDQLNLMVLISYCSVQVKKWGGVENITSKISIEGRNKLDLP